MAVFKQLPMSAFTVVLMRLGTHKTVVLNTTLSSSLIQAPAEVSVWRQAVRAFTHSFGIFSRSALTFAGVHVSMSACCGLQVPTAYGAVRHASEYVQTAATQQHCFNWLGTNNAPRLQGVLRCAFLFYCIGFAVGG